MFVWAWVVTQELILQRSRRVRGKDCTCKQTLCYYSHVASGPLKWHRARKTLAKVGCFEWGLSAREKTGEQSDCRRLDPRSRNNTKRLRSLAGGESRRIWTVLMRIWKCHLALVCETTHWLTAGTFLDEPCVAIFPTLGLRFFSFFCSSADSGPCGGLDAVSQRSVHASTAERVRAGGCLRQRIPPEGFWPHQQN